MPEGPGTGKSMCKGPEARVRAWIWKQRELVCHEVVE